MYRDQREALHARVEALEAELEAERAARVAAEARCRAAEARSRATEARVAERRLSGAARLEGAPRWWGRPWVALAISLLLACGIYLTSLAARQRASGVCPHRDQRVVLRVLEEHRGDLQRCYHTALEPGERVSREAEVRLTVEPSGEVAVTTVHGIFPFHHGLANCIHGSLRELSFPPLSRGRPVTVRFVLDASD
jgi:hypothetical protein